MNGLPGLQDPTNGLFRRAKILEMGAIPEGERDPNVIERIPSEVPGILTWALEGLQRLNKRGHFDFPPSVKDASARFLKDNDLAAQFIEDRCERGEGAEYQLYATPLTNAYNEWALANGHAKRSSKSLAQDWRRLGLDNGKRDSHGQLWRGIRLKATKHL